MLVEIITSWRSYEDYWYRPIFIWSSRRDYFNKHFITTHCCSNVLIYRMESMTFFNTLDLTHWAAWGDLLSTWKHKYYLPSGGNCVVFGNSTGGRGKVVINRVKRGVYMWPEHWYYVSEVLHRSGYHLSMRCMTCFELKYCCYVEVDMT